MKTQNTPRLKWTRWPFVSARSYNTLVSEMNVTREELANSRANARVLQSALELKTNELRRAHAYNKKVTQTLSKTLAA